MCAQPLTEPPQFEDIQEAAQLIEPVIYKTPLVFSESLSQELGCEIYLKLENLQKTGAYKLRGAYNKLLRLTEEQLNRGVVTASAGNHAQGVGYAAKMLGCADKVTVYMPATTPIIKVKNTKDYGVTVKLSQHDAYDAVSEEAHEAAKREGKIYIEAFNDWDVIAGQGTIGLEILEALPDVNAVLVPVGGGGLCAGVATAIKGKDNKIKVIGVEAGVAASMIHALREAKQTKEHYTPTDFPHYRKGIADGIDVKRVGDKTLPLVRQYVDFMVAVGERDILNAMMKHFVVNKIVVEGAGAAPLAALMVAAEAGIPPKFSKQIFSGRAYDVKESVERDIEGNLIDFRDTTTTYGFKPTDKVVLVVSGANIDPTRFTRVIEENLRMSGQYLTIKVIMPDRPGALHQLTEIIARRGNIVDIIIHRTAQMIAVYEAAVEIIIETPDKVSQENLLYELKKFIESNPGYKLLE
jgi:threonine dehydratase